ncbi:hypothetical protein [Nitrososphaera viennensis]|uniref:Uncharacterized protein n=2 Tax=Nitrososphaera viennensis TaxID=1034015 RepID=A0A060HSD3_9ARCH|nr:hypothetical protein [Nitrososphaera viennensis]AIC16381.1 hypothetical protein NVIE_021190 [Nitrososphaera viennensis EN76]UVS68317.1 hypothetical protein NWT39_10450 [Nitrososphaera viennensis]
MEQADESLPELLELNYFSFSLMKNNREFSLHVESSDFGLSIDFAMKYGEFYDIVNLMQAVLYDDGYKGGPKDLDYLEFEKDNENGEYCLVIGKYVSSFALYFKDDMEAKKFLSEFQRIAGAFDK